MTIRFTKSLKRFFPELTTLNVHSDSLQSVLMEVNKIYPGIRQYILDERGSLRKHVNIFIDGEMLNDRITLSDNIDTANEIYILQALSGG
ncbi:MAG: molybdenum cofactor biosynthesis protein MoaD [Saprospiraceae bacterium]